MARPQTATDEEILAAAQVVIERRGHEGFTLSEVAEEVGLSRAAITLRFKSAQALKLRLMDANVGRFLALVATLPREPHGDNLLEIAAFIGRVLGKRDNFATFLSVYSGNMKDRDLAALEHKRGMALREVISLCMPETVLPHAQAVATYEAHLTGSIMAWPGREHLDPSAYLVECCKHWLTLAQVPYTSTFTGFWMKVFAAPVDTDAPERARRPRRTAGERGS